MLAGLAPSAAYGDEQLTLKSRGAQLAATLLLPALDMPRPLPAVVLVHGSGRLTADDMLRNAPRLLAMGLAVLAYDKRGVGSSTGESVNVGTSDSIRVFDVLADDALSAVEALSARKDIDASRIGLLGISQGGWIAPLAASRSAKVAFVVCLSGPAVSVGEEIAYSRLAGEDPGSLQGLADDEIDRRMRDFKGPYGYEPAPALESLRVPSFWVLGEQDHSIPLRHTLAVLRRIAREKGRPIQTHVIPGANHALRDPGGRRPDFWSAIGAWLAANGFLPRKGQ